MSQKERTKRYRDKLKEEGKCIMCRQELDREGIYCTKCCEKLRLKTKERREFLKNIHVCPTCGKNTLFGDEKVCLECLARKYTYNHKYEAELTDEERAERNKKMATHNRNVYAERKAKGICVRCGERKAVQNRVRCAICLNRDAKEHYKNTFY